MNVLAIVASLQPGQAVDFENHNLAYLPPFEFGDSAIVGKCDRILENVVGSGYGWWYVVSPFNDKVTFKRLKGELREWDRTYVSPDRRDHYTKIHDGLWRLKPSQSDRGTDGG